MSTPAAGGFRMPSEWARHEATWLAWPHSEAEWPGKVGVVEWAFGEMIRRIAPGETVRLCAAPALFRRARAVLEKARVDLRRVEFLPFPTNRGWMRDTGPMFVTRGGARKESAIVHFHFNAWARYADWRRDRRLPDRAAALLGQRLFRAARRGRDFVLEGGSVDVNGRGSVLTTEECLLDQRTQVRNPGLGRRDVEDALRDFLGVRNVLWLGGGIVGDDTHGHVDDICRFVNPTTVVLCQEKNLRDANYRALAENRERLTGMRLESGSKINVVPLPMPSPLFFGERRLPASYANFYISNETVIVPTFNDPNDRVALGILADLFRGRTVIGIHAVDLVLGRGALHCLTQQQPAL